MLLMLNEQQFYLFGQIQTCQTGGQPYSDTFPYGEYSMVKYIWVFVDNSFVIAISLCQRLRKGCSILHITFVNHISLKITYFNNI